jgi:serine phosphatase RsbU (regulator of sigma subunit)/CHASE3 domain sensor protein
MRRRATRPLSLPLRWRVFALLMSLAALLILDAVLGAQFNSRLEAEQQVVARLRPVEEYPELLVSGLVDQQNSVRGFALTRDERLLKAYVRRQVDEGRYVTALHRNLRDEPDLLRLVNGVETSATAWHQEVAEPVIRATRDGRRALAVRLVANRDQPLFSSLRRQAERLGETIDDQLARSQLRAQASGEALNQRLLVFSGVGLAFVLLSGLLIRRWLTRPVAELSAQVRLVATGRLGQEIVGSGPAELARLGDDVEVMRRRILEELQESRRAFEGLEQNAPLVTSLRSELMGAAVTLPTGVRMAARFEPAEGVLAGDWLEAIRLDEDRIGVIVVDVSGHGPEAGLRALLLKHLLVPALNLELDPADALHWVAGQIGETDEWFATCVIFEVDATTGRCLYANAGHPPVMLVGRHGVQELWPTGPLFSDLPGARWETEQTTLEEDDILVVYTDGITEARNAAGEEFGEERLAACLTAAQGSDIDEIADRVMQTVHEFAGRLSDDATLVLTTCPRVYSGVGSEPAGRAEASR